MVCKMGLMLKISAAALSAAILSLLLRRSNPELSAVLTAAVVIMILTSSLNTLEGLRALREQTERMTGKDAAFLAPVLKCLGISVVSKLSAELCRDCGQSAAGAGVELAGTLCAAAVSMPLLLSVLKLVGELI